MKRGVAYIRVSTEEQAKDDHYGIPAQRVEILRFAAEHDITIYENDWYIDAGISGSSRERPEFGRILSQEVQNPPIECVIVAKADRISRDVTTYYVYKDLLARKNIDIISVKENWGGQDKITATILEGFMAIMADVEREVIKYRFTVGREGKARHGGYAGGRSPYGYDIRDGSLVINEEEAETVRLIFQAYDSGRSLNSIAQLLNAEGVLPRRGQSFHASTIREIVQNRRTYQGYYRYGEMDWVKGQHEPILSDSADFYQRTCGHSLYDELMRERTDPRTNATGPHDDAAE